MSRKQGREEAQAVAAKQKTKKRRPGLPPAVWLAALIALVVLSLAWFVDKS